MLGAHEDPTGSTAVLPPNASDFANGYILYVGGDIPAYIGKQPQQSLKTEHNSQRP